MAKGNATGPGFEGGFGTRGQIPSVAREHSYDAQRDVLLRRAQQLGITLEPVRTPIVQTLVDPAGNRLLELFLKSVFRSFQQHVRLPSHHYPPYLATSIDEFGTGSFAAGAEAAVVSFAVPNGHRGVIVGFGHDVDNAAAWNDVTWSIRVNNRRRAPYFAVTDQVGTVLNPWRHSVIHVREGRTVALYALNGSGSNTYNLRGRLVGWFYPVRQNVDGYEATLQE